MALKQSTLIDIPGKVKNASLLKKKEDSYIMSIFENKSKEMGISILNIKRPMIQLSQFCDVQTYIKTLTELFIYQPTEILLPFIAKKSELEIFIRSQFPLTNIVFVEKKYFSEKQGSSFLKDLATSDDQNDLDLHVSNKQLCLASVSALIHHVQNVLNISYLSQSLKINYRSSDSSITIDSMCIRALNLIDANHHTPGSFMSLYDSINNTKTPQGARLLRSNILQPPNNRSTILVRQQAVKEIVASENMYVGLMKGLSLFSDIDDLISELVHIPSKSKTNLRKKTMINHCQLTISNMVNLKRNIDAIPMIIEHLEHSRSDLLSTIHDNLSSQDVKDMSDVISKTLNESMKHPSLCNNRTNESILLRNLFLVKDGINGTLDVARKVYSDRIEDVVTLVDQYKEDYEVFHDVKILFNSKRGYFLSIQSPPEEQIPDIVIFAKKNGKRLHITTERLIALNERIRDATSEILVITDKVVKVIQGKISRFLPCIYRMAESIAYLDMLFSFATYAKSDTQHETCCPELTEDGPIAINEGVHPILSMLKKNKGNVVPNNTYISSSQQNFHIITGENNSGKTTYLTQVACITIMAHMGGYIPAHFGSFRIVDRIFTRIGNQDSIEMNASSFLMEMKEMAYIINNANDKSLVLIDELGRSTSYYDAVPICWSLCEKLMSMKALVLLSTHFLDMAKKLEDLYPMVKTHRLYTEKITRGQNNVILKFHYNLQDGCIEENEYGISLAQQYGWPYEIVSNAHTIRTKVLENIKKKREEAMNTESFIAAESQRLKRTIIDKILILKNATLDEEGIKIYISELKSRYTDVLSSINEE